MRGSKNQKRQREGGNTVKVVTMELILCTELMTAAFYQLILFNVG